MAWPVPPLIPDFSPPLCGAQQCYLLSSLELLWDAGPGAAVGAPGVGEFPL